MKTKIRRQNLSSKERKEELDGITNLILEDSDFEVKQCPHCGSIHIIKKGKIKSGHQKYLCKDCKKYFIETYGTIFYRKKLCQAQIKALIVGSNDESCRRIARKLNINYKTVCTYRHIILNKMAINPEKSNLTGEISFDETLFHTFECRKRNNGIKDLRQSSEKILIGADTDHHIYAVHLGDNTVSLNSAIKEIRDMISNGNYIIHDAIQGIENILSKCGFKEESIQIIKACLNKNSLEMKPVNNACSSLKYYLNKHKAISSKWLQAYINYYNYDYKNKFKKLKHYIINLFSLFGIKNGKILQSTL